MRRVERNRTSFSYAFDELNRLIVRERNPRNLRLRPARILNGRISTDSSNRLVYHLETPPSGYRVPLPRRLILDGRWRLTPDNRLEFGIRQAIGRRRRWLHIRGTLSDTSGHTLSLVLKRRTHDGKIGSQGIKLSGRWQADAKNRLIFLVDRTSGRADRLTLAAGWELDRRHTILYRITGDKEVDTSRLRHTLRFRGIWDVPSVGRLVYRLEGTDDSLFSFRAAIQTRSLNARDGRLAYQVGIGLSGGRSIKRRVTLFGRWKLNKDMSVAFEIAGLRRKAIRFKGSLALSSKNSVTISLSDRKGAPYGMSVTFRRDWFRDKTWFLTLRRMGGNLEALAGVHLRF